MIQNKIYSLLGLAQRGGHADSGGFMVENSIKSGKACLVIIASDASENTRKKFGDMCAYRQIPIMFYGTGEELGHAIGKEMRVSIAVTDHGLAGEIMKQIGASENNGRECGR